MSKPKLFQGKNLLIYLVVGYLFYFLYSYRMNDPLRVSQKIPITELRSIDGTTFKINDYRLYKMLIFFDKSNIYTPYYLEVIPELKILAKNYGGEVFLILKKPTDKNETINLINEKKYNSLENITYRANIKKVSNDYGVRSWPHFFLINADNVVVYEAKNPSVRKIVEILRSF